MFETITQTDRAMKRYPALLVALVLAITCCPVVMFAAPGGPPSFAAAASPPASLLGLTRAEVIAALGKPTGERQRGEWVVMVYPDGTRLELREGRVAAVSGRGAEIIAADGTRYAAGDDGNLARPIRVNERLTDAADGAVVSSPAATSSPEDEVPQAVSPPASPDPVAAEAELPEDVESDAELDLPEGANAPPSVKAAEEAARQQVALELDAFSTFDDEAGAEVSPVVAVLGFLVLAMIRFILAVFVLWIALRIVGLSFFWGDLLKVALLYVAVHGAMNSLGALGGLWEFVRIFRMDDIVGMIVLTCSLTWFKVVVSGLTALKVGAPGTLAIVMLMRVANIGIVFATMMLTK